MQPLLLDIPRDIDTPRLTMRCARPGDGAELHAAISDSWEELHRWLRWARTMPTVEEMELKVREQHVRFHTREDLVYHAYLKGTPTFAAGCGLHRIDWSVPRFEIGYWVRTPYAQQGFVAECVHALTRLAFKLGAARVEIRAASDNVRSCKVAEKCGFELEGTLRRDNRWPNGDIKDMRVYSRIEPPGD